MNWWGKETKLNILGGGGGYQPILLLLNITGRSLDFILFSVNFKLKGRGGRIKPFNTSLQTSSPFLRGVDTHKKVGFLVVGPLSAPPPRTSGVHFFSSIFS